MDIVEQLNLLKLKLNDASARICTNAVIEILDRRNQLAECQKDAERYHWLKARCFVRDDKYPTVWLGQVTKGTMIETDKAIDKAMSEKG